MLFKSQVLTQASGSIGGITYSHNKGGMYQRARAIPTNPNSTGQAAVRMYFTQAISLWTNVLTQAQRDAWDNYAANTPVTNKLGDAIQLSGQNMFVRIWTAAARGGLDPATDYANFTVAPTNFNTGDPGTLGITSISAATNVVTISIGGAPGWAANDLSALLFQAGNVVNASRTFYRGPFRGGLSELGNSTTPITSATFDLDDLVPAINASAADRMWVRLRALYSDGRLTAAQELTAIIAA